MAEKIMLTRRQVNAGIAASLFVPAAAAAAERRPGAAALTSIRDAVRQMMRDHDVIGVSVTLTSAKDTLWSEGFGYTDHSERHAVTPATLFSVQSISKTYTTTAFMRLVDAGELQLDQTLRSVVPQFTIQSRLGPQEQDRITFRQLLAHRAGLPHEAPRGGNFNDCGCSFDDHIESVFGSWLKAKVGERYSYSNVGIDLVGYAMEQKLGRPFERLMTELLLAPVGMASSTFQLEQALKQPLAIGQLEGKDVPPHPLPIKPSGGLYSNGLDMARFVRLQLKGGAIDGRILVPSALLNLMGQIHEPVEFQVNGYGLGLERRVWHNREMLAHGGGGFGFQTEQRWLPEDGIGVVVLTNYGGDDGVAAPIADRVLEIFFNLTGTAPANEGTVLTAAAPQAVPAEVLAHLEGSYRGYSNVRRFQVRDGRLNVLSGNQAVELVSHGPAEFTTDRERYRFRLDNFGRPMAIDYLGPNGVDTYFPNGLDSEAPGPNKPEWQKYLGDYEGMAAGVVPATSTISMDNGFLSWSRAGGTRLEEYREGLFFASDGESVILDGVHASLGNRPFARHI
jgi:CubicO group peptidase (beta-lactamase class C family)